jgi:GPH family glycoside/pentoside/hexuronide:cation symporter
VWFLLFYVQVERGFDSIVLGLVLGLGVLTMPITVKTMHRFGKRNSFIGTMAFFIFVLIFLSFTPQGGQYFVLAVAIFAGLGLGAANVIPWAMVADVIEEDELKTGKRREGSFSGYLVFFRKLGTAFAIFFVTWILAISGFIEGTTGSQFIQQPESALFALRFLVGIFPAFMLIIAITIAWRYPLSRERHEEIRRELAIRRARQAESTLNAGE